MKPITEPRSSARARNDDVDFAGRGSIVGFEVMVENNKPALIPV